MFSCFSLGGWEQHTVPNFKIKVLWSSNQAEPWLLLLIHYSAWLSRQLSMAFQNGHYELLL